MTYTILIANARKQFEWMRFPFNTLYVNSFQNTFPIADDGSVCLRPWSVREYVSRCNAEANIRMSREPYCKKINSVKCTYFQFIYSPCHNDRIYANASMRQLCDNGWSLSSTKNYYLWVEKTPVILHIYHHCRWVKQCQTGEYYIICSFICL